MQNCFEKKVEAFVIEQNLIAPGERVLVGLSGGADSTCLLTVLHALAEKLSISLGAFHVNHGIRGKAAASDEQFSRELSERLGVPFFAVREDVPALAKEWRVGEEEAGRRVRYETAERLAAEQGYQKIALAHHQNDVAETLLFHLFRGTSVDGLSSIPERRGCVIRPLLCCTRDEIEAYLEERGISYCTDATNEELDYTRNKIRHRIVAYAEEEINAGAVKHMAETAAECAELSEFLSAETEKVCCLAEETADDVQIPIAVLKELHCVLQKRVVHRLLGTVAGSKKDITKEHVTAVLELLDAQSGKRVSLPYHLEAGRSFEQLFIRRKKTNVSDTKADVCVVEIPGTYPLGESGEALQFRLFPWKKNSEIPKNEYTKWFDYDKIRGTLCLRTWEAGDRIGMQAGMKSVKSVWLEHKVSAELRRQMPLVADEEQVLWIPGIRCCDNYRIDETTKTVLEVHRNGGKEDGSKCEGSDFRRRSE